MSLGSIIDEPLFLRLRDRTHGFGITAAIPLNLLVTELESRSLSDVQCPDLGGDFALFFDLTIV